MERLEQINHKKFGIFEVEDKNFIDLASHLSESVLNQTIVDFFNCFQLNQDFLNVQFLNHGQEVILEDKQILDKLINSTSPLDLISSLSCSVKLSGLQNTSKIIQELTQNQYKENSIAMTCNMYLTPCIDKPCLNFHVDPQDVYIVQLLGQKDWFFPRDPNGDFLINPFQRGNTQIQNYQTTLNHTLKKGSALKISQGHIHKAFNKSHSLSVHLSFSIFKPHQLDIISKIVRELFKYDLNYLQNLMNNSSLEIEDSKRIKNDLQNHIANFEIDQKTIFYYQKNLLKNAYIAKNGRPYSYKRKEESKSLFQD